MANLLSRLRRNGRDPERYSLEDYAADAALSFGGGLYGFPSSPYRLGWSSTVESAAHDFGAYTAAVRANPTAFSAQVKRAAVLSEARFTWRNNATSPTPGRTWGSSALSVFERPWQNATTGDLIARMEWHAGLAGNAYVFRDRAKRRLKVLRPDWVIIVLGSDAEPDDPAGAIDADVLGYAYYNGGPNKAGAKPVTLLPADVAHWAPLPDPEGQHVGMAWLTPAIREMQVDRLVTEHKMAFFRNGATPNLVVKGIVAKDPGDFTKIVDELESQHTGVGNAYRTIYLKAGADASVVGANLQDLDLKSVQGAGETRVSALSGVPAAILGISEGLQGSSLNQGNLGQSRRIWGDTWCYPSWRSLCASLHTISDAPSDSDLWFDAAGVSFLREDAADLADIRQKDAITVRSLVDAGFNADAAVRFVQTGDLGQLLGSHSGLFSVQLQPAGADTGPARQLTLTSADVARVGELFPGERVVAIAPAKPMPALPPGGS